MEKSVKNAVFKGFPVLMESDTFGSKQNSQTTNKETNNSLSSFFRVYYLVSKCMGKRVADQSAIDTALVRDASKLQLRGTPQGIEQIRVQLKE